MSPKRVTFLMLLAFVSGIQCKNIEENSENIYASSVRDCKTDYSTSCFKLDIANFVERISKVNDVKLLKGLSLVKDSDSNDTNTADIVADLKRSFPNDPSKRVDEYLITRLSNYLSSRSLRVKFLDETAVNAARSAFTGRKGKIGGKKGGLEGLLAAAMMMKGTLMAIALGALALLAGKALAAALMALLLSAIVGLKSLASGGNKSTTYEIIAKPHYTHSNSHSQSVEDHHHGYGGHSGYGRSADAPIEIKNPFN